MNKGLLIVGAGQYAHVVFDIASDIGYDKISFVDDFSEIAKGRLDDLESFFGEFQFGIVAIGNPEMRKSLTERLEGIGYQVPTLVHPMAFVSPSARLGTGVIVEPNATVQANSSVDKGSIISSGAVVRHNGVVGEFCHCDCGSVIQTGSSVCYGTKVNCGEIF